MYVLWLEKSSSMPWKVNDSDLKNHSLSLSLTEICSECDEKQSTMPELGFQDHNQNQFRSSAFRSRDFSPDSVIFTADQSNFSLFSSASCSVERCSFASDLHDHDSVLSEFSQVISPNFTCTFVCEFVYENVNKMHTLLLD